MNAKARAGLVAIVRRLIDDRALRLEPDGEDGYAIPGARGARISGRLAALLLSSGLLQQSEGGRLAAGPVAPAWLERQTNPDLPFQAQHNRIGRIAVPDAKGGTALGNLDESPVAALARRPGRDGQPWLRPHEVAAAERFRRDFEAGQLQPRITANWSASVANGRRAGSTAGLADLTDIALSARSRLDAAIEVVGPELSGVLLDVCCFLKGLEEVERERQWPARSAKLVLRLGLEALARHYGLSAEAQGSAGRRRAHRWAAEDYRPEIS